MMFNVFFGSGVGLFLLGVISALATKKMSTTLRYAVSACLMLAGIGGVAIALAIKSGMF